MQEFYLTVTAKLRPPLPVAVAQSMLQDLCRWPVFTPGPADVLAAIRLQQAARLSFRDAMIVHAAAALGCRTLWTEDLAHGATLGGVRVRNPFRAA